MFGQWGKEIISNGIIILPHIKTKMWEKIGEDDIIDTLVILSSIRTLSKIELEIETNKFKKQYVGQKYSQIKEIL